MNQKVVVKTTKQFLKKVGLVPGLRTKTKQTMEKVIRYRLQGYSYEVIGNQYGLTKSRIFEIEKQYMENALNENDKQRYKDAVASAKKKLTSIQ